MTGNASSSPWQVNERRNTRSKRLPVANDKVRYFYLQRRSAVLAIILVAIAILVLLALTYGWHFDEPIRRTGLRLLNNVLLAVAAIPIWYKLPITIPLISESIAVGIAWFVFSTDKHPDFVISSHSVFGLSYMSYRRFRWSQVERIEVVKFQRKNASSGDKPVGYRLVFHTNVPRAYPVIGGLLSKNHTIRVNTGFSEIDKATILELVKEYAPHKSIVETTQFIKRRLLTRQPVDRP